MTECSWWLSFRETWLAKLSADDSQNFLSTNSTPCSLYTLVRGSTWCVKADQGNAVMENSDCGLKSAWVCNWLHEIVSFLSLIINQKHLFGLHTQEISTALSYWEFGIFFFFFFTVTRIAQLKQLERIRNWLYIEQLIEPYLKSQSIKESDHKSTFIIFYTCCTSRHSLKLVKLLVWFLTMLGLMHIGGE